MWCFFFRSVVLNATLLVGALFLMVGCEDKAAAPIRIAISSWAGVEPAELAARLGLYEKWGVKVELLRFSAYSDSLEALKDKRADAGMHTLDDVLRAVATGHDLRTVLLTDSSFGGDGVVARKGIKTMLDLKGKTVGVEIGTVGHYSLLKALEVAGVDEQDIHIKSIPAWEIKENYLSGRIDAGVTWEPYLSSSARESGGKVLITSRDYPETIFTTMSFDATVAKERRDDVRKVVGAYFEAVSYMKDHPVDAYRIMAEAEGISTEEFTAHAEGLRYLDLEDNARLLAAKAPPILKMTEEIAAFLHSKGVISSMPDTARLFDSSFVLALQDDAR